MFGEHRGIGKGGESKQKRWKVSREEEDGRNKTTEEQEEEETPFVNRKQTGMIHVV